ncbi:MAG TPA: hypothetical protein VLV87_08140 [Gammaproteobacteria bacterium]|nr:hypothetical protein [Gammaproteobacteria bacterium]
MAAFLAAFMVFMVLHYLEDVRWFRWDAGDYWNLAELHRLLDFPAEIRGYFYPMLLAPARYLFDLRPGYGYLPYRVVSSLAYAYMLAVALPGFYTRTFGGRLSFWRRLLVPVLLSVIFPGTIVYPLSDLPAVCLMLGAITCAMQSVTRGQPLARYGLLLLCGILAYGAYNTRTIFLFPAVALLVGVPWVLYRGQDAKLRSAAVLIFLVGATIASVPQVLINARHHGTWNPAVITTDDGRSLFAQQLLWGMVVQRYETTLDGSAQSPAVVYPDHAGERLVQSLHLPRDFSIADYFGLLLRHPVDFMGIYGRHLINGLDVRDGDIYSRVQSPGRNGKALFNFLVLFLGLLVIAIALLERRANEAIAGAWFWALVALLPVGMIVPGAIETRFFLPLDLALYSAIAFGTDGCRVAVVLKRHGLVVLLAFGFSASMFFAISMATMADYEYGSQHVYRLLMGARGGEV